MFSTISLPLNGLLFLSAVPSVFCENDFLAKSLGSNMVLQRDVSSSLYGYSAAPSTSITIDLNGTVVETHSASELALDGGYYWKAILPPKRGGFDTHSIKITSGAGEGVQLDNIVFGDVFLCSGQSNMQFGVEGDFDSEFQTEDADNLPYLRVFSVGQDCLMPQTETPIDDLHSVNLPWSVGSKESVNSGDWAGYVSAACYFFGKHVFNGPLKKQIPVGLVSSNWGGTYIESWAPPSVMKACGVGAQDFSTLSGRSVTESAVKFSSSSGDDCVDPNAPSVLYNTMIYPFRDMQFKGAVWYQGESNIWDHADKYPCLQNEMVKSWRSLMGQELLPFLYTQISTWNAGGGTDLLSFRNYQFSILSLDANTGMITAADLGDPDSPYDEIHPRNKTEVGRRLALAAQTLVYQDPVPHTGPYVSSAQTFVLEVRGESLRVQFDDFSAGPGGLHLLTPQECPSYSREQTNGCGHINLIYERGDKARAQAEVFSFNTIDFVPLLPMTDSGPVVELQYCLGDYPLMTVYNSYDIPLIPIGLQV